MESITIHGRSDLIVSKTSKRTYFTVTDETDRKLLCFNPTFYDDLQVGKIVELDIQQGKMADDTPRIVAIVGKEAKPDTGSSAKPSSEQDRRSQEISEHVWWKELGLCLRAGDIDKTKPAGKALRKAYYAKMFSVLDIKIEDTLTTE